AAGANVAIWNCDLGGDALCGAYRAALPGGWLEEVSVGSPTAKSPGPFGRAQSPEPNASAVGLSAVLGQGPDHCAERRGTAMDRLCLAQPGRRSHQAPGTVAQPPRARPGHSDIRLEHDYSAL